MRRASKAATLLVTALAVAWGLPGGRSQAGPARYDVKDKSFTFAYTFAALTPGVLDTSAIGAPQTPNPEQNALVRALLKEVSDALFQATGGRAKIARLDMVDDIKSADIVISLTGQPEPHAWATLNGFDGKPGQMAFFYNTQANQTLYNRRDAVLTAVHEMGHYLFGLADEYDLSAFPGGCPLANPGGPGCLMDNYNTNGTRHGWYGRFCKDDHNTSSRQPQSCQAIVDKFFTDRNVPESSVTQTEDQVVMNLASAALGEAREQVEATRPATSTTSTQATLPAEPIRERARRLLNREVSRQGLRRISPVDISKSLRFFGDLASLVPVPPPVRIGEDLAAVLLERARELATKAREARRATTTSSTTDKEARIRRIKETLFDLVRSRLGGGAGLAPGANVDLSSEEKRFVDSLARAVSDDSPQSRDFDMLMRAAWEHIQLDLETARNVVELGDVVGVPGTANRLQRLAGFEQRFKDLYLPGRTYPRSRFGFRRTLILAPDPLDPRADLALTQSGVRLYSEIRESCIDQFARLIDRERIEPVVVRGDVPLVQRLLSPGLGQVPKEIPARPPGPGQAPGETQGRYEQLQGILAQVVGEIRKNSLENILLLVPPDGLPDSFGRSVEGIRGQVLGRTDVRFDVVLIGSGTIPPALRDLSFRSGGSIITATDIDEVGAIAQRLRNEQAAGAWVILPRQGVIPGDAGLQEERTSPFPWVQNALTALQVQQPPYETIAKTLLTETGGKYRQLKMDEITARATDPEDAKQKDRRIQTNFNSLGTTLDELGENTEKLRKVVDSNSAEASQLALQIFAPAYAARETLAAVQSDLASLEQPLDAKPLQSIFESSLTPEEMKTEAVSRAIQERKDQEQRDARTAPAKGPVEKHTELDPIQESVRVLQRIADRAIVRLGEIMRPRPVFRRLNRAQAQEFIRRAERPRDALVIDALQDQSRRDDRVLDAIRGLSQRVEEVAKAGERRFEELARTDEAKVTAAAVSIAAMKAAADAKRLMREAATAEKVAADAKGAADAASKLADAHEAEAKKAAADAKATAEAKAAATKSVAVELTAISATAKEASTNALKAAEAKAAEVKTLAKASAAAEKAAKKVVAHQPLPGSPDRAGNIDTARVRPDPIKLARFYAERGSSFELILGSTRPLPGVPVGGDPFPPEEDDEQYALLPRMRLFTDDGAPVEAPTLRLDPTASTSTILVYRLQFAATHEGRFFNVEVSFSPDASRNEADINYTFSISASRPNVELITALVQSPPDLDIVPPPSNRGLVRAEDGRARIEVQVLGGVSILNARINGFLQKIGPDIDPIDVTQMAFADDGLNGDSAKDDGIYTGIIPIDRLAEPAEYRVGIQAVSTEASKNIQPEDPFKFEDQRRREARRAGALITSRTTRSRTSEAERERKKLPEKALQFERATSLHFRVER